MSGLTKRQEQVLHVVKTYILSNLYPPTIQEVSDQLSITKKGIVDHLQALERKGYLTWDRGKSRSIVPVDLRISFEEEASIGQ